MNILHATNKVGLLPYRFSGTEAAFLLHLPRPKKAEEADLMKWGVARGTVRRRGEAGEWLDIRDAALLPSLPLDSIEPHVDAALHEAEEELGLLPDEVQMELWRDHGLLTYDSETKGSYALHLFSVRVRDDVLVEVLNARAQDSLDVAWFTLPQMRAMVEADKMKAGYLPMVEAVLASLAT